MVGLPRGVFECRCDIGIFKVGEVLQGFSTVRPARKHFEDIGHAAGCQAAMTSVSEKSCPLKSSGRPRTLARA